MIQISRYGYAAKHACRALLGRSWIPNDDIGSVSIVLLETGMAGKFLRTSSRKAEPHEYVGVKRRVARLGRVRSVLRVRGDVNVVSERVCSCSVQNYKTKLKY